MSEADTLTGVFSAPNGSAYPPSIQAGIPRLGSTPQGWKRERLSELLTPVYRPAELHDEVAYQLVTAKRNRAGIVARERLTGAQIKVKDQYFVRTGDFIISNRQISHGGCGLVPPELDGAIVSGEYTVLNASGPIELRFLDHFAHSIYFQQICFHSSIGVHVEKLVFRPDEWFKCELNLPPLGEQRRVADALDAWDRAIKTSEALSAAKRKLKGALLDGIVPIRSRRRAAHVQMIRLGDLGEFIRGVGYDPDRHLTKDKSVGVAILTSGNIQGGELLFTRSETLVHTNRCRPEQLVQSGDFVISMSNGSRDLVGKAGLCRDVPYASAAGAFCATFRPRSNEHRLLVAQVFQSNAYLEQLHIALAGSSINNLTEGHFSDFEFACAPVDFSYLAKLDEELNLLREQVDRLRTQKRGLMQKLLDGKWRLRPRRGVAEVAA